jgi:hypothetical protein
VDLRLRERLLVVLGEKPEDAVRLCSFLEVEDLGRFLVETVDTDRHV